MEIRRAADRAASQEPGIVGRHCFSWGAHYDPDNISFGPLVAANIFDLEPGAGFDLHPHAGVEIVTWVDGGELTHTDSEGSTVRLRAPATALFSTGAGASHSERNEGATPLRIVQLFLHPDGGTQPRYVGTEFRGNAVGSTALAAASPRRDAAARLRGRGTVWLVEPPADAAGELPAAAGLWALVLAGSARLGEVTLEVGDELRARPASGHLRAGHAGARVLLVSWD